MSDKVTVNIYGTEYTIAGGDSRERVIKVAAHVDGKMREIDEATGNALPQVSLAVLSSVNMADEYFAAKDELKENKIVCEQLEGDTQHYIQLWDEAKKAFQDYKDDNVAVHKQKEELMQKLHEKEKIIAELSESQNNFDEEIRVRTKTKLDEASENYKELENNYFDLQMENIRLKSEVERLKNQ